MRVLSDHSGTRTVVGFDDYLTGYSLPDERLFAFARTWYAEEEKRPGCVWTHSLLVDQAYFQYSPSLQPLLNFFRRPSRLEGFAFYDNPISSLGFNEQATSPQIDEHNFNTNLVSRVMCLLYSDPLPIILLDDSSDRLTSLHLELWRNYFSLTGRWLDFCTGAMQLRRTATDYFDLQTVPTQVIREVLRSSPQSANVIDPVTESLALPRDYSLYRFCSDEIYSEQFKEFLAQYASLPTIERASVKAYSEVFQALQGTACDIDDFATVVDQICLAFPEKSDAVPLKQAVAAGVEYRQFFRNLHEVEILRTLTLQDSNNAFDPAVLNVPSRLIALMRSDRTTSVELVRTAGSCRNDISQMIIATFADNVDSTSLPSILSSSRELVPLLVDANPSTLASPSIWHLPHDIREQALSIFFNKRGISKELLGSVIESQLNAETSGVADRMVSRFGIRTATGVFNWAAENRWRYVPSEWQQSLENLGGELTRWITRRLKNTSEKSIDTLPRMLALNSSAARSVSLKTWMDCVNFVNSQHLQAQSPILSMYAMNLGFDWPNAAGEPLLSLAFPNVYSAALRNTLDDTLWSRLEQTFKTWWWWDRCRTLRTALVAHFAASKWSPDHFIKALPSADVLWEILSAWGWSTQEKKFLAQTIAYILSANNSTISEELVKVALRCAHWFDVSTE
jgi:hypothetical protein